MTSSPTVLIISAVFPPEPVVSAVSSFQIAGELARKFRVVVVSPRPTRPFGYNFPETDTDPDYPFEHVVANSYVHPQSDPVGRTVESISFGNFCSKYIARNHRSISMIYAITWPLFAQAMVIRAARRYGIPIVLHVTDLYPESYVHKMPALAGYICTRLLLPLDRYNARGADSLIAISPSLADYIARSRGIPLEKISVARTWQEDGHFLDFDTAYPRREDGFTFLFLGNVAESTGLEYVIKGFLAADLPSSCRLVIAGDGPHRRYCEQFATGDGCERIIFTNAPKDKVMELQLGADALVLPLRKGVAMTATPSKMTAYFYSARPVLASVDAQSDTAMCIREAGAGIITEPDDTQKIAEAFLQMYYLPYEKRREMGLRALEFAKNRLSKASNLQIILDKIHHFLT